MIKRYLLFLLTLIFLTNPILAEEVLNDSINFSLELKKVIPSEIKLGDSQLSLQIQNSGNETMEDISAFIVANGFSTYEIIPIDVLSPGQKSYILVMGNFKEEGNITMSIRIKNYVFYKQIFVTDPESEQKEIENIERERERQELLANYSSQLNILKRDFDNLELTIEQKTEEDYDVSKININELKGYLRNLESSVLAKNLESANINLILAKEEYQYQLSNIEKLKKKPTIGKLRDYAIIFSTFAGALITFFALSELLKKKSSQVAGAVQKVAHKKESI